MEKKPKSKSNKIQIHALLTQKQNWEVNFGQLMGGIIKFDNDHFFFNFKKFSG